MAAPDVEYRCFVGGLAWATDDRSLEAAFSTYGEILDSKIINDRETGRSRGFGFVTFSSEQSMRDAIEGMNGKELDGRNITVNEAQSRRSGGGGGGYGGGGGGYGGGRGGGGHRRAAVLGRGLLRRPPEPDRRREAQDAVVLWGEWVAYFKDL